MANIEIKSSLLNDEDLKFVKQSLIEVSEIDNKDKFRVRAVEYINDSSYNNDDMFFYDMIEFIRFLKPNDDAIAYTTPDKEIFLNCPSDKLGEDLRYWEFVYDHECLHQLWDTFGVGDKIKEEKGSYDHEILNIASDCVINDYLDYYRKKKRLPFGIFPDVIKKDYGVDYDRKKDTQYSLYLKLMEVADKIKNSKLFKDIQNQEKQDQQSQQNQGQGQQGSGSGSSSSSSNSQGGSSNSNNESKTAEDAKQQAKEAQEAADKAKEAASQAEKNGDKDAAQKKEAAKKAQEAADKAKEAAKKAQEAKDKGDKEGETKAAKEAQDAADEAKKLAGQDSKDNKDSKDGKDGKDPGKGHGKGHEEVKETEADLKEIKERAQDIIDKYRNKISGSFGEFIEKCKSSKDLKANGLEINTHSGSAGWNQKMNSYVNAFVKKKVYQKKREFQETYTRIRRGSSYIEYGKPIKPGKKLREEKLTINAAFYIDRSGSMGGCIKQVFKACYTIAEALKKKFKKEQVVDKVEFKLYAFDDSMVEIKYGNQCNAGGGTMSFDRILDFIDKNTEDFLINIIITDAEFNINEKEVDKLMKNIKGMLLFITNNDNPTMKKISKNYETQLFYILADSNFEIQ